MKVETWRYALSWGLVPCFKWILRGHFHWSKVFIVEWSELCSIFIETQIQNFLNVIYITQFKLKCCSFVNFSKFPFISILVMPLQISEAFKSLKLKHGIWFLYYYELQSVLDPWLSLLFSNMILSSIEGYFKLPLLCAVQWPGRIWTHFNTREVPSVNYGVEPAFWCWFWKCTWHRRCGTEVFYDSGNRCLLARYNFRRTTNFSSNSNKLRVTIKEGQFIYPWFNQLICCPI